jgi:hypothetical protein
MGDWRTLHLFDKAKYIKEVVPMVRNFKDFLPVFLNENRSRRLNGFSKPAEEIIAGMSTFVSELSDDLSAHPELTKLCQVTNKNYDTFYSKKENFIRQRQDSIELFEYLIIDTIFSSVAYFNPYFVLGKRVFEGFIEVKSNSIAQALTTKITSQNDNSILDVIDGGIINWLSSEEVELLHLDKESILPLNEESNNYLDEFKTFLEYAHERNLGLISLRNPRESDLINLKNDPDEIIRIVKNHNFKHIIVVDK